MTALQALLSGGNALLDQAALDLAAIEFPDLEPASYLSRLDELAARVPAADRGEEFVAALNHVLFEESGFTGNAADYYNPRNSCLNEVLERRAGIPITLSVLYMEVARRVGRPVLGIGLPGHFVVQYDDGRYATYIDVFHGGALLDAEGCRDLAQTVAGVDIFADTSFLRPVTPRQILVRMLNNLRSIYFRRHSSRKAAQVLDYLLLAMPDSAAEYRQRAVLNAELKRFAAAREDFHAYLRLSPDAADRTDVERQLHRLQALQSSLN
ncbi:MAG: transglutaminase-like domain-containing protein [Bryobacteraceae bacterium]|nr:transglutaminase-like domain-containing protein [Bryobacteraceae bacterium]